MLSLPDNCRVVQAAPVTRGTAVAGDWISLKGYAKAMCIINIVTGADDTELTFTVDKGTTAAGGDESTGITLNNFWYIYNMVSAAPTSDAMTKGTAAASIATVTDQSTSHLVVIDIDASELGTVATTPFARFDWLQLTVAGGNAAHTWAAVWVLYNPRYGQDHASMLTAIA